MLSHMECSTIQGCTCVKLGFIMPSKHATAWFQYPSSKMVCSPIGCWSNSPSSMVVHYSSVLMQGASLLTVCHMSSHVCQCSYHAPMLHPQHICLSPQPTYMKYATQPKSPQVKCPTSKAYITWSQALKANCPCPNAQSYSS
jgi:hypothetical protein